MPHTAELIAVGTELLLGSIANTDAQMISRELAALGIDVYYHTVVGDNPGRLRAAVEIARSRADLIVTTGGLGPTCDDLTKNVLAECFGRSLVFHPESARRIESFFAASGREMTENNLQQAMLPEGCTVLTNDWGTAPGCAWEQDGITVVMLPGPPRECSAMLRHRVVPYLRGEGAGDGEILSRTLCLFGIGESAMEARLRDEMLSMSNPTLAPYAKEGSTELRITAKAATPAECEALIAPVEAHLRAVFGDLIYGADVKDLAHAAGELLLEQGKTLATAESCTGGMIAARLTEIPGISAAFRGGIVCYTDAVKRSAVGVPEALLEEYGAVSRPVCASLAECVRARLNADLGVGVTGLAGPDGDERGNPVGLIFVGLSDGKQTWVRELHLNTSRGRNRNMACHHAFDMVRRYLTGLEVAPDEGDAHR
ncbi:MAG: competence/damage-inducible protein A [Oscillospiraceae bacterium]|nr:competence/damage-inducible protein A [Oscillospiraceae bacterium]